MERVKMQNLTKWIDTILRQFLIALMALLVFTVTWQVLTRFILRDPSSFTEELARFLLIWIGLLGAAYALRTKAHLGIDILLQRSVGTQKKVVEVVVYSFVVLFSFFVMILGGYRLVSITLNLNQLSAAMGIKMGYIYTVLPISGTLMIYYSIVYVKDLLAKKQ
jgi:TRAP-type C4-dicarboxylate transport system permease small subunit